MHSNQENSAKEASDWTLQEKRARIQRGASDRTAQEKELGIVRGASNRTAQEKQLGIVRESSDRDRTAKEKESRVVGGGSDRIPEKGLGVLRFADVRIPEENAGGGVVRGAIARITEHNKTQIKADSWNRAKRPDAGLKRKVSGKPVTRGKIISNFCGSEEMII